MKKITYNDLAWREYPGITTLTTDAAGNVLEIYGSTPDPGGGAGWLWMARWKNHHTTLTEFAETLPPMWVAELRGKGVKI